MAAATRRSWRDNPFWTAQTPGIEVLIGLAGIVYGYFLFDSNGSSFAQYPAAYAVMIRYGTQDQWALWMILLGFALIIGLPLHWRVLRFGAVGLNLVAWGTVFMSLRLGAPNGVGRAFPFVLSLGCIWVLMRLSMMMLTHDWTAWLYETKGMKDRRLAKEREIAEHEVSRET